MQPKVIAVSPRPMRPFQGWRYLDRRTPRRPISPNPRRQRGRDAGTDAARIARSRAALIVVQGRGLLRKRARFHRRYVAADVTMCKRSHSDGGISIGRLVSGFRSTMSSSSGSTPMSLQVAAELIAEQRGQALSRVPRETLGASRLRIDMPLRTTLVPAGRVRCTPPASVNTQARSQRVSVRVTLASSGPPGRLSAKHSVSSFPGRPRRRSSRRSCRCHGRAGYGRGWPRR